MLLLALDTATPTGSLAVFREGNLAGGISTVSEEPYSSRLFRELDLLLHELHLGVQDFDVFAVGAGPGSFTGLRVGLTAVKAWAEVFSKPIVAVSGLEAIAVQAQTVSRGALIAPILDARRGQIYAALYRRADARLTVEDPEQVCTAAEFIEQLERRGVSERVTFVSPTPAILQSRLPRTSGHTASAVASCEVQLASPVLAPIIGRLALERASRGEFTDALRLDANYIRRSDAELLWKAR